MVVGAYRLAWLKPFNRAPAALSAPGREAGQPGRGVEVPPTLIDEATFAEPPLSARPGTRWWWGPIFGFAGGQGDLTEEETRRQLRAIHEAGFGRVEIAYGGAY